MFQVQYYCPKQGDFWQIPNAGDQGWFQSFESACGWADILKPPEGYSRVIDYNGAQVYFA